MLLILAALQDEIRPILNEMDVTEQVYLRPSVIFRGEYKGKEILLARTGLGRNNMHRAAEFCFAQYKPDIAVNVGYCGSLTPNTSLGDIIIANNVIEEESERYYLPTIESLSQIVGTCGVKYHLGTILTMNRVIETPHEKAYLGTKFDAIAVDMESSGLAESATKANVRFSIVRAVLDTMDMHLPKFGGILSEDGKTSALGLLSDVIMHPRDIASIPQIQYCAGKARSSLTRFVDEYIKTLS